MKDTVIVTSQAGIVKAIATNGTERLLRVGDRIYMNEQIATSDAGAVAIEFADGSTMNLGRNVQFILDEEILRADVDTLPEDTVAAENDVRATEAGLIQDENFDPTVNLEPPAAGLDEGTGHEGGFSFIRVEFAEPRVTAVSDFETTEIGNIRVEIEDIIIPELLLDPQQTEDSGLVDGLPPPGVETPEGPIAAIFTLNEDGIVDAGPVLIDGDASKLIGFSIEPDAEDAVTSVTIKGFPENVDPTESDWFFGFFPEPFDDQADYSINFREVEGPIKSSDAPTWEVPFEVTGALPGEKVVFVIPVIPLDNIADNVVLEIETTVDNSGGGFTSSRFGSVAILFDQPPADFPSASTFDADATFAAAPPVNSFFPTDFDTPAVDGLT